MKPATAFSEMREIVAGVIDVGLPTLARYDRRQSDPTVPSTATRIASANRGDT